MTSLERAQERLADIRREQARQSEFAGIRLGVFAGLKELGREERRVLRRIETLTASASLGDGCAEQE